MTHSVTWSAIFGVAFANKKEFQDTFINTVKFSRLSLIPSHVSRTETYLVNILCNSIKGKPLIKKC